MAKPPLMVVALAAARLAGACSSHRIILPAAGSPDTGAPPNARDGNTSVVAPLPWDGGAWPEAGPPPASAPDASNQCAAQSFTAPRVPLDLLLLVDRSESMSSLVSSSGTNTKWDLAAGALDAFIADDGSNGLGIGLELFPADQACTTDAECLIRSPFPLPPLPGAFACVQRRVCAGSLAPGAAPTRCGPSDTTCPGSGGACLPLGRCSVSGAFCAGPGTACPGGAAGDTCTAIATVCEFTIGSTTCQPGDYDRPLVAIAELPAGKTDLRTALAVTRPRGSTPTTPAVTGALGQLRARLAAHPDRRAALVLVTDGLPTDCSSTVGSVADALAMASKGTPAIPTYAVGVFGPDDGISGPNAVGLWATAGGTGMPFVVSPTEDLRTKLLAALSQIRGAALPCEYTIPRPASGTLDYGRVNLHYKGPSADEDVGHVSGADRCDPVRGGWYYDVDPAAGTPTRLVACPATCARFKADAAAQVEVRVGCKTVVIE